MIQFFIVLLITISTLTVINITAVRAFGDTSYIYFIVFLINIVALFILTQVNQKQNVNSEKNEEEISEKSVAIFIRLFIYIFPIVALFGLYGISILDNDNKLGIEDANSWIGFILGIASFVMSLITLWQGQGTYNKIFSALEDLRRNTDDIKRNTDITDSLKANGIDLGIRRDLLGRNFNVVNNITGNDQNDRSDQENNPVDSSGSKNNYDEADGKTEDETEDFKNTLNKSPFS
jgi:hypothetical protein